MASDSVREFYNRQYGSHIDGEAPCPHSLHDLAKAHRRVARVFRGLNIDNCRPGAEVLDIGSGLGYYTKALSSTGASVTGIDFSETAIALARATFPGCRFLHAAWHEDVDSQARFDLIWAVNFSLVNTFDVDFINQHLVLEALRRLKPNGSIVIGWNTDFSGRRILNYAHWSIGMLSHMRRVCGVSAPFVPEARTIWLSWILMHAAALLRRSIPVFMVRQRRENVR